LGPGDFAGVFALLSERKRQASLQAETDLSYFELHRNVVEEAAREDSGLSQALQAFFRERVTVTALAMLPGFRDMEPGVRAVLAQTFRTKQYEDGAELFYEGAEICGLWLVLEGNVQVGCESTSGEVQPLRTLPPGHFLGTLAALEHAQTDGAAVAQGVVTTVTLWHRALVDLARQHPSLLKLRSQVAEEGLAITTHIWGGSAQLPTNLSPGFVQGDPRY
jgi:CRP-like cAMP-binding protein